MTEVEWAGCTDAGRMLWSLRGRVSERKVRLFAAACCRRLWDLFVDPRCGEAVIIAERFADGLATADQLRDAHLASDPSVVETGDGCYIGPELAAHNVSAEATWPITERAPCVAYAVGLAAQAAHDAGRSPDPSDPERAAQSQLLRCVFGTLPFRPVSADPSWLSWDGGFIPTLAAIAYEDRIMPAGTLDAARLAVLSDALEEAGCTDTGLLAHLRSPGPHVRGCWALDLVLGKG